MYIFTFDLCALRILLGMSMYIYCRRTSQLFGTFVNFLFARKLKKCNLILIPTYFLLWYSIEVDKTIPKLYVVSSELYIPEIYPKTYLNVCLAILGLSSFKVRRHTMYNIKCLFMHAHKREMQTRQFVSFHKKCVYFVNCIIFV